VSSVAKKGIESKALIETQLTITRYAQSHAAGNSVSSVSSVAKKGMVM